MKVIYWSGTENTEEMAKMLGGAGVTANNEPDDEAKDALFALAKQMV